MVPPPHHRSHRPTRNGVPSSARRRSPMPKYLYEASYTAEGVKGLLKDGGSKRRAAVETLVKGLGGRVEALYFAYGDRDAYVIVDLPDSASATAVSLAVG